MGRGHDHTHFAPVAEIPYGDDLTAVIEEFASAEGLEYASYYHDLPIWLVYEQESGKKRIRRLQVVAYLVSREPYISLLPSVHILAERHKMRVPKRTPAYRFDLKAVVKHGKFSHAAFRTRLSAAWEKTTTLRYSEDQLMEVEVADQALCC